MQLKPLSQTYEDGVVKIYNVANDARSGNMPVQKLEIKHTLMYNERIVGMQRYWIALQAKSRITMMLRVPRLKDVGADDIAIPNDGKQYRVLQVQYPPDVYPLSMDLSLERLEADYDFS